MIINLNLSQTTDSTVVFLVKKANADFFLSPALDKVPISILRETGIILSVLFVERKEIARDIIPLDVTEK